MLKNNDVDGIIIIEMLSFINNLFFLFRFTAQNALGVSEEQSLPQSHAHNKKWYILGMRSKAEGRFATQSVLLNVVWIPLEI